MIIDESLPNDCIEIELLISIGLTLMEISYLLFFMVAMILITTAFIAHRIEAKIGFNARRWGIIAGIIGALIYIAKISLRMYLGV